MTFSEAGTGGGRRYLALFFFAMAKVERLGYEGHLPNHKRHLVLVLDMPDDGQKAQHLGNLSTLGSLQDGPV